MSANQPKLKEIETIRSVVSKNNQITQKNQHHVETQKRGTNPEVESQLAQLEALFTAQLMPKIKSIQSGAQQLNNKWNSEVANELKKIFHRLAGSSASFGRKELGLYARQGELIMMDCCRVQSLSDKHFFQLSKVIVKMRQKELERSSNEANLADIQFIPTEKTSDHIFVLEEDPEVLEALTSRFVSLGYSVKGFRDLPDLEECLLSETPLGLIIDIQLKEGEKAAIALIRQLKHCEHRHCPVVVFTSQSDFQHKLDCERAGVDAYLQKPIDITLVSMEVERLLGGDNKENAIRVMIIDDDEALATHYSLVLKRRGLLAQVWTDAELAVNEVKDFNPDLIILDIYMPQCTGLEIARIFRFDSELSHIPIVFFSTEATIKKQLNALSLGGDDFLAKPIADEHFEQAILARAKRARNLKQMIGNDGVTGLMKYTQFMELLDKDIYRSHRGGASFCVAKIDLDRFRLVNDNYGNVQGDKVLREFAIALQKRIRTGDFAARVGGDSFAIVLHDCELNNGVSLMSSLQSSFFEQAFLVNNNAFRISFSAGICQYQEQEDAHDILEQTTELLGQAKQKGRNKICF